MANEIRIAKAINSLNSSANFTVSENDIDRIWWDDDTTPIAKADILAKQAELQAEYDAQEYARKRKEEYPSIEELVVALYDTDDKSAIEAKRAEVKAKYTKT